MQGYSRGEGRQTEKEPKKQITPQFRGRRRGTVKKRAWRGENFQNVGVRPTSGKTDQGEKRGGALGPETLGTGSGIQKRKKAHESPVKIRQTPRPPSNREHASRDKFA